MNWEVLTMRSATSSCKALLRSDLRRYWPVFFCYTFMWMLGLPMGLWNNARWAEGTPLQVIFSDHIYGSMPFLVLSSAALGVVLAMTLYGYLMKSNSVGLMHSLPVSRTTQYFTHFGAGMLMTTAGNVLVVLISVLMELRLGAVEWESLLWWLLIGELLTLFFFAFATLCASVTGWTLGIPIIFLGVNFMVKAYSLLISGMGDAFYYGYSMRTDFTWLERWLTPLYNIYQQFTHSYGEWDEALGYSVTYLNMDAVKVTAIYAVIGVGLLALGLLFYRLRHSETAGDAIVFPWLKPIVRYVIAIAGGIGLGFGVYAILELGRDNGSEVFLLVCQLVMGFVVYCAVEMLMRKRFKIFDRRTWIGLAALFAVIIGLFAVMKADLFGYEKRIPATEDVESVWVTGNYLDAVTSEDPAFIELVRDVHRVCLDKKELKAPTGPWDEAGYSYDLWIQMEYTLKNGSHVNRAYNVPLYEGDEMVEVVNRLINSGEAKRQGYLNGEYNALCKAKAIGGYVYVWETGDQFQITGEQAEGLRQAVLYDVENLPERNVTGPGAGYLGCDIQLDMDDGSNAYLNSLSHDFAAVEQLLREYGAYDVIDVTGPWELAEKFNKEAAMIAAFGEDYDDAYLRFGSDYSFELSIGDLVAVGDWERNISDAFFARSWDSGEEVVYSFTYVIIDGLEYLVLDGGAVGADGLSIYWTQE